MISINTNKILNAPELHISIFAFLLNFVWELLQMPLFAGFADFQHYQATLHRTKATFGGAVVNPARRICWCLPDHAITNVDKIDE